jgi:hypothetical protein
MPTVGIGQHRLRGHDVVVGEFRRAGVISRLTCATAKSRMTSTEDFRLSPAESIESDCPLSGMAGPRRANYPAQPLPAAARYPVPRFTLWWRQTYDLNTMRVPHQQKIPRSSARRLRDCRAKPAAGITAFPTLQTRALSGGAGPLGEHGGVGN